MATSVIAHPKSVVGKSNEMIYVTTKLITKERMPDITAPPIGLFVATRSGVLSVDVVIDILPEFVTHLAPFYQEARVT